MKKSYLLLLVILLGLIAFFVFQKRKSNTVEPSFYYWKSVYQNDSTEQQLLKNLDVKTLYMKYFDVIWDATDKAPKPTAVLAFDTPCTLKIIPVIYIVNDVFKKCTGKQLDSLAINTASLIKKINASQNKTVTQIQLDCDWTDATQKKYFSFLKKFKAEFDNDKILFSATIRLHQIKYFRRTGLPPVQRGMLMFYNMGKLKNPMTENSIFDKADAEKYTDYLEDYPLPLDYALPVFSWGVLIRNNKVISLINNISASNLDSIASLKKAKHLYGVTEGFFFKGTYLMPDDIIRVEEITPNIALQAAKLLNKNLNNTTFTVSLFHLDSTQINRYELQDYKNIYSVFN